ncbi:MAG: PAS domain S-box protein [Gammaproteobacteria bacterium]|nr:PAS domain S-box protein [Gammaproteobacteria bacterium]MDH3506580.1 PAS domain S-box protein [Gammaproteobacteria bacterium]
MPKSISGNTYASDPTKPGSRAQVTAELKALFDAAVDGIIVIDEHGVIAEFNKAAERLFGRQASNVVGLPVTVLMAEPHRSMHETYISRYLETGEARIIGIGREVSAQRADGSLFPIALSVGEIEGGKDRRFIGLIRDLSAQKAAEEEAHSLQNRLAHVGRFNLMGEMAAGLAHELNQPLSAIVNYSQAGKRLAEKDEPNIESVSECYAKITEQALRAGHIIDKLRDFLRKDEVSKCELSINDVVSSTLKLVEADARAEGIPIHTDLADDLPATSGDLIQLQQVLMNLTRNAVDAMRESPNKDEGVIIRTSQPAPSEVQVSVLDHGHGVPPQLAKSIFHPFVTTKRDGLGVGLAISRTIIRAHDGELFCRRNPIGGAIFGFNLPVADER